MNNNIKAGADLHAGDGGYSEGTKEKYDEFVKGRNQSLGNMRIRELAEQASKEAFPLGSMAWMEKFAELIVRECIDIVSPYAIRMENFDGGHPIADLKKHFGVEE